MQSTDFVNIAKDVETNWNQTAKFICDFALDLSL